MEVALPPWGQVLNVSFKTHGVEECASDEYCAIHNPSHHMGDWPIVIRLDYGWPMVERQCKHGIGHPDPDSLSWYKGAYAREFSSVHGCDGCCQTKED